MTVRSNDTSVMVRRVRLAGLVLGPLLGMAFGLGLPASIEGGAGGPIVVTGAMRATVVMMTWMATWWLTEAVPISATALLPLVLAPLLGAGTMARAAAPFADPVIFLFMGGFILALSMQRWGLDRRIALVTLGLVGTRPSAIIAGFMLPTAVMSMFVSNTATAAMMLPLALSVASMVHPSDVAPLDARDRNFSIALMLGIAYAASIGGIGTKIGSPPNGIVAEFVAQTYGHQIGFVEWLAVGLPLVVVFLPITWWLLTRVIYPVRRAPIEGAHERLAAAHAALGPMKPGEWATLLVFLSTVTLWVTRPYLGGLVPALANSSGDSVIVMAAALALFVIPVDRRAGTFAMDWETAVKMPWGVLMLFGGGLSLAATVQANGVADLIGAKASILSGVPPIVVVLAVAALVIFLTELTSNTATTATLVPIFAAAAVGLGVHPYLLIFPTAIGASCAFMMPVATPPNAIVFASGRLTIPQMCRAGLWLNLIAIVLVTVAAYAVVVPVLGRASGIGP
ncbi:MAG: DASS family sodium-coupled anion symporter [Phycisphaerales bacterium]|nr:DASS family sodium-coupled anion symporter [Phycisphaerales bacterium]